MSTLCMKYNSMIASYVNQALDRLYEEDAHLIKYYPRPDKRLSDKKWYHVGERSIVFRFALYFYQLISEDEDLVHLDLDCEYNRNNEQPKILDSFEKGTYPDLILHKRNCNDYNILVMEFKGYWNKHQAADEDKLQKFTTQCVLAPSK